MGLAAALGVPGTLSHSLRPGFFPYLTYFFIIFPVLPAIKTKTACTIEHPLARYRQFLFFKLFCWPRYAGSLLFRNCTPTPSRFGPRCTARVASILPCSTRWALGSARVELLPALRPLPAHCHRTRPGYTPRRGVWLPAPLPAQSAAAAHRDGRAPWRRWRSCRPCGQRSKSV